MYKQSTFSTRKYHLEIFPHLEQSEQYFLEQTDFYKYTM